MELSEDLHKFRVQMIEQGEADHLRAIAEFPVRVNLGGWCDDVDTNCERMTRIEHWLRGRFESDRYLAFPCTSVGQYKEDCFVVFMRDPMDAVIFKLSTL